MSLYRNILDWCEKIVTGISAVVAGVALVMMAISISYSVLARNFSWPQIFGGSVEFSGYMMIITVFAGAALAMSAGTFLRVDLVIGRVGPGFRHALMLFALAVAAVVTFLFLWDIVPEIASLREHGVVSSGNLQFPRWIPVSIISCGLLLLFIEIVIMILREIDLIVRGRDADELLGEDADEVAQALKKEI